MAAVTMPDGNVVDMPDQLDPALGARLRAFHDAQNKPAAPKRVGWANENLAGPGEILASGIANIPGAAVNAVSDLVHRIGGDDSSKPLVPSVPVAAGGRQLMSDITSMLSPKGDGSDAGSQVDAIRSQAMGKPNATVADVVNQIGGVGKDALNIAPVAGAAKVGAGAIADSIAAAKAPIAAGDIEGALKAVGYPSLPSKTASATGTQKVGAGVVGEQSLTGPQSLTSQAVTDRLAQHEAGLADGQELNYANIEAARKNGPAKVYDAAHAALPQTLTQDTQLSNAIKGIGDTTSQLPSSPDVDMLKQHMLSQPDMTRDQLFANVQSAREKASKLFNATTPDAPALADAYQGLANAYEDFIGRQLSRPELRSPVSLEDFQNARTAFAKNYAVQTALKGTSVDANKFATLQRKEPGLLTGPSSLIAEQANRYPLSAGFGPTTLADTGMGASGSIPGQLARRVGTLVGGGAGGGLGYLLHGPAGATAGAGIGAGAGDLAMTGFQNLIRRALSGTPEKGAAQAGKALAGDRLSDFFSPPEPPAAGPPPLDLTPPPGKAFEAHQPALATGSPQRDFFGTGADHFTAGEPGPGAPPAPHQGEISLMDLLSHGTEQPPPPGLSLSPMGAPAQEGIPFQVNADHAAGGLSLQHEPTLMDLLENLQDHPKVMSQGVPEDILQRSAGKPKVNKRDQVGQTATRQKSALFDLLEGGGG